MTFRPPTSDLASQPPPSDSSDLRPPTSDLHMFSRFFIDRPIFASVLSIIVVLGRDGSRVFTLPVAQYPEITPPTVEVSADLSGGEFPSRRRQRGRADRAAGQRRREHALHVVAMHQRRQLHAHGDVQPGNRSQHRAGARAESRLAGQSGLAAAGAAARRAGEEEIPQRADDHQSVLARWQPQEPRI